MPNYAEFTMYTAVYCPSIVLIYTLFFINRTCVRFLDPIYASRFCLKRRSWLHSSFWGTKSHSEINEITEKFLRKTGFPVFVGALDGTRADSKPLCKKDKVYKYSVASRL